MFTGLVEEIAIVRSVVRTANSARISISANKILEDIHLGDSIAVNGICLTVTDFGHGWFSVDAVPETVRRTNLRMAKAGSRINVERAMQLNSRFGGHIVSGHIDGVGILKTRRDEDIAVVLTYETSPDVLRYVVSKGSICVNGVSLTVMDVDESSFSVSVIPHTGRNSSLLDGRIGDVVNLECDVIAKYLEKLVGRQTSGGGLDSNQSASVWGQRQEKKQSRITMNFLQENGFL